MKDEKTIYSLLEKMSSTINELKTQLIPENNTEENQEDDLNFSNMTFSEKMQNTLIAGNLYKICNNKNKDTILYIVIKKIVVDKVDPSFVKIYGPMIQINNKLDSFNNLNMNTMFFKNDAIYTMYEWMENENDGLSITEIPYSDIKNEIMTLIMNKILLMMNPKKSIGDES